MYTAYDMIAGNKIIKNEDFMIVWEYCDNYKYHWLITDKKGEIIANSKF